MTAIKGVVFFMGFLIVTLMGLIIYGFYQKSQNPDFKFFADNTPPTVTTSHLANDSSLDAHIKAMPPAVSSGAAPIHPAHSFGEVSLDLPGTARVISVQASGSRLVMTIARDGQNADLVAVVDMSTGKVLGRVKTTP